MSKRIYYKTSQLYNMYKFWFNYFSPANFSYWWNFGSMALICLILQIITGLFLAMHYKSDINLAFASIEYISREVQYGWLLRYMHSNGASVFFIVVYLHILRGLAYGSFSYPRHLLWGTGVLIFFSMIATAFFGYVLPWGQMSFRAATVIISLFSAIPVIGMDIVLWLWGGFSVDDATSNRFYSLHFFLPFVILGLSILHIMLLHEFGSNNPWGIIFRSDYLPMGPYYIIKDLNGWNYLFILLAYLVFMVPNLLGHPDNFILSNPLVTPTHIVPEWYFSPFYAVLRSIPSKLLGVIALAFAILVLLFLPAISGKNNIIRSFFFKPVIKIIIVVLVINYIILGWIGGQPVVAPYYFIGQIATFMYYLLFGSFAFAGFIEQIVSKVYSFRFYILN
jgi:ubiquinol-cytochrome c reductase cytochrome b subunit